MLLQYTCSTCMNSTLHTDIESNDHRCAICGEILKDKKEVGPKLINLQDITADTPSKLDRDKAKKTTTEGNCDKRRKTSSHKNRDVIKETTSPGDRDNQHKTIRDESRDIKKETSSIEDRDIVKKSPGATARDKIADSSILADRVGHAKSPGNKQRIIEKIIDDKIYFKE